MIGSLDEEAQADLCEVEVPDIPEIDAGELLDDEKRLLGFYVSGHPLDRHKELIRTFSSAKLAEISKMPNEVGVKLGGMLNTVTRKLTKQDQKPFAIFQLEDLTGNMECICYNKVYEKCKEYLLEGAPVFVKALTKRGEEENAPCALMVQELIPLMQVYETDSAELHIHLDGSRHNRSHLEQLGSLLTANSGEVPVILCIHTLDGVAAFVETGKKFNVKINRALLDEIDRLLGEKQYRIKAKREVPQARPRFNRDWKKEKEEKKG